MARGGGLIGILRAGCLAVAVLSAGFGLNERHKAAEIRLSDNSFGVNGIEGVLEGVVKI